MNYLDPARVINSKRTKIPLNRNVSGYGSKVPSNIMLQLDNKRWYRVYVMIYSNVGSSYILEKGKKVLLGSFEPNP